MATTGTTLEQLRPPRVEQRLAIVIVTHDLAIEEWHDVAQDLAQRGMRVEVIVAASDHPLMSAMHLADAHLCLVPEGIVDVGDWARHDAERAEAMLQTATSALSRAGVQVEGRTSGSPAHRLVRSCASRQEPPAMIVLVRSRLRRRDARAQRYAARRCVSFEVLVTSPPPTTAGPSGSTMP